MPSAITTIAISLLAAGSAFASPIELAERQSTSLNSEFVSHGKKYWGTAADPGTRESNAIGRWCFDRILTRVIVGISQNAALIRSQFGQVTPENSMKWDATESSQGRFTYGNADQLVQFAQQNNKLVRGHTLLWHSQLPSWVSNIRDRNQLTSVIQNHIANVAGHFKGKIYAWDVVNEIFAEDGTLRQSVFSQVLGEDFVRIAFEAAKKAVCHVPVFAILSIGKR